MDIYNPEIFAISIVAQ